MKNGLIITEYGIQQWYKHGKLHREDGPAIIHVDGSEQWFLNNKRHRLDGPVAIWLSNGTVEWWINGRNFTNIKDFAKAAGWTDKKLTEYLLRN